MAKAKAKKDAAKVDDKKPEQQDTPPGLIGHNKGEVIPEVGTELAKIEKLRETKRTLGKEETEIKNGLKKRFGFSKKAIAIELAMRQLDKATRGQLEAECHDLRVATGYQYAMDLAEDSIGRSENEFVDPNDPEGEANKLAGVHRKPVSQKKSA